MRRNPFVKYLNSLHNVDAENPSAYTEMSITNQYFRATMVERDYSEIGDYMRERDYVVATLPDGSIAWAIWERVQGIL